MKETILSGVEKCYMSANPGPEFEVEAAPEMMKVEKKKAKKKIVAVKSKSPAEMARLAKKKERARKKLEAEKKKEQKKMPKRKAIPKRKATPKRKRQKQSPKRRVQRNKAQRKQKK